MGSRVGNGVPVDLRKRESGRTMAGGCLRGAAAFAPEGVERLPDSVRQMPRCLLRHAETAVQLHDAHALEVGRDQVDCMTR